MNRVDKSMTSYIHLSKYSRFLEEEQRRETWEETIQRSRDFWCKRYPSLTEEIEELFQAELSLEAVGSMRTLMTAGEALDRDNAAGFNCAGIAVTDQRVLDEIFYLLMCGSGVGFSVERQYTNQLPTIPKLHDTDTCIDVYDSKIGWAKALKQLIGLLYIGEIPIWDTSSVRPAGARLKTFGGRASGPEPLDNLFRYVVRVFTKAEGRKLNSLELHDLICKIADTVIVGSVRRSACISLSNLSDSRMAGAKNGEWYLQNPHRALANNSVAYTEKPDIEAYTREMSNLYSSKAGERGIINKVALKSKAESCGRKYDGDYLLNPCMTGDTMLLTDKGYMPIGTLVGVEVNAWNGECFSAVTPFSTGVNNLLEVTLSNGVSLRCTPYHKFILRGGVRAEAQSLTVGDCLEEFKMPVLSVTGNLRPGSGYSQGFYSGNGYTDSKYSHLYYTKFCCEGRLIGSFSTGNEYRKEWNHGYMLDKDYVPINEPIQYKLSWLAGILDSNGNIQRNPNSTSLVVPSMNYKFLCDCRLMLTTLGVQPVVCLWEEEEGIPGGRYSCKGSYRLLISAADTRDLIDLGLYCERLDLSVVNRNASRSVTVVSVHKLDAKEETYCATEPLNHSLTFNGIVTGQCGEAILRDSGGLCNLSEVICRATDTLEDLKRKVRFATIHGTLQSTLSDFRYLRDIWKKNQEEERLLGVSLTGIMDHKLLSNRLGAWEDEYVDPDMEIFLGLEKSCWDLPAVLKQLKQVAIDTNKEWAKKLGIEPSKHITLIKPSGTVSQLCGTSSGIHPRFAPYYLRRVTQDLKDPLTAYMIREGIPYVLRGEKAIFSFPIRSPEGSVCTRDMGAIEQLELWKIYREHWCDGNPSQTIFYTDDSFLDVQAWVYKHWDIIGGLSFFPLDDYVYDKEAQPYLEITKEEYEESLASFPAVSWESFHEDEDVTTGSQELACSGGQCEL